MARQQELQSIRDTGSELVAEVFEIRTDLARLQAEARNSGDWKRELAVLDRRMRLVEMHLRDVRERVTNSLHVNFDLDQKTTEKMATAFLARQRLLRDSGEEIANEQ